MKNNKAGHSFMSRQEEELVRKLKKILSAKDLTAHRLMVERMSEELGVNHLDCAAALACLCRFDFQQQEFFRRSSANTGIKAREAAELKMVRYRLEVGRRHRVVVDELKKVLVDETGVEKKHIGFIDIHNNYTIIKLPEGMPSDIFNHLKTVQINQQVLRIKRLGNKNRSAKIGKVFQQRNQR